jgi:hypothetical protein
MGRPLAHSSIRWKCIHRTATRLSPSIWKGIQENDNAIKQLLERISKEMKRGKLEKDVKELIIKSFREFYTIMYQQRNFWESKFKSS